MASSPFRRSSTIALLYAAVCLPAPSPIVLEPFPNHLPVTAEDWTKDVSLGMESDVAITAAATFSIGAELPYASVLKVGPWHAGLRHAEYRYNKKFPVAAGGAPGTLRGVYRTEGLFSYGTVATASFYKGASLIGTQDFYLEPNAQWSYFQIPLRFSPPGTDSVGVALGVAQKHSGQAMFSELSYSKEEAWPLKICQNAPPLVRPGNTSKFQPPGLFRVQNTGGVWWLVAPDGRAVYSAGVAATEAEDGKTTGEQFKLFTGMGFNSVGVDANFGGWITGNFLNPMDALWMFQSLNTSRWAERASQAFDRLQTSSGAYSTVPGQGAEHSFPDPYDPKFAVFYRASVRTVAQYVRNAPWFVGYYADTGLGFTDLPRRVWSPNAAQAFMHFLLVKYGGIGILNMEWATSFASFDELASKKPDPETGNASMARDFALFARELVKRYVLVTGSIIREEDPNHLIFSNRFTSGPELLEALPYLDLFAGFDGVAIDLPIENVHAGMTLNQRGQLELLYRFTGRPIIVSATTLAARDFGHYDKSANLDRTFWNSVPGQSTRASQAAHFLVDLYNTPYVIGAHWAGYRDTEEAGRRANVGIVSKSGNVYKELGNTLGVFNHQIYQAAPQLPIAAKPVLPKAEAPKSEPGALQSKAHSYQMLIPPPPPSPGDPRVRAN